MMKCTKLGMIAACMVFPAALWAQTPATPKTPSRSEVAPAPAPQKVSMASVLNKRIESIEWDETPLETVMEWVQEQGPINVVVRWRALEIEGITEDTPVSLRLRNATVSQILNEALESISGSESGVRYRGIGNTLQVSTRADFNSKLYTKTYDAADLLFKVKNFTDGPTINIAQQNQGGGGGGGGGSGVGTTTGTIFEEGEGGEEDDEDSDELDRERMEELVDMIRNTVEPDTWQENGGKGTIVGFQRSIVVRNNIEVHEKLGGPFSVE